jgi:HEAT repeat protein
MLPESFADAVRMLRSEDPDTFENAYCWLQGDVLRRHIAELVQLLEQEQDHRVRARLVEVIGDADLAENVPLLVRELSHECREVRAWAFNQLALSNHEFARACAEQFRLANPHETFHH